MEDSVGQGQLISQEDSTPRKRREPSRKANDLDGKEWLRNSISIWSDIHKTSEERSLKHPAMFPAQLVSRLLKSFTRADQKVILDPFSGIGSTALVAEMMGKLGIGLDISEDYISKAERRPPLTPDMFEEGSSTEKGERRSILTDARNLTDHVDAGTVDMVVTSPPTGIFSFKVEARTTRKSGTTATLTGTWEESPDTRTS